MERSFFPLPSETYLTSMATIRSHSARVALTVALQPRSLLAAALFVAITAIALAVALES
jgi:hypothetical protein